MLIGRVFNHRLQRIKSLSYGMAWRDEKVFLDKSLAVREIERIHPNFVRFALGQRNTHRVTLHDLANVARNCTQHLTQLQVRSNSPRQVQEQLESIILTL